MSPSRTRKPVTRTRPRHELVVAIAGGVAVILGTVLIVWLLRPGPPASVGTGGLFNRQQRATLLFVLTALAIVAAVWWLLRRYKARRVPRPAAIAASVVVILVLAVIAGILWPGGLIHHYRSLSNIEETPPIQTPTSAPKPAGSSTPKSSTPATTTPATTAAPAPSSTPSTGG